MLSQACHGLRVGMQAVRNHYTLLMFLVKPKTVPQTRKNP